MYLNSSYEPRAISHINYRVHRSLGEGGSTTNHQLNYELVNIRNLEILVWK
jgi:hypothetical protein